MTEEVLLSTVLLSLTILVLIAISLWQVAKIFEMSQPRVENSQIAEESDNRFNGKLMLAFLFFIYGLTFYSFWRWGDVLLPESSSEHGYIYDNLMWTTFAVIFLFKQSLRLYFTILRINIMVKKDKKHFFILTT